MILANHLFITGDVTGVGYRLWMKVQADSFGVFGWVKNKDRGVVEAVIQGEGDKLRKIIDLCKKGPDTAWVKKVEVKEIDKLPVCSDFKILR